MVEFQQFGSDLGTIYEKLFQILGFVLTKSAIYNFTIRFDEKILVNETKIRQIIKTMTRHFFNGKNNSFLTGKYTTFFTKIDGGAF